MIACTIESLLGQRYPGERFTVHVIADNCTDATAEIAAAYPVEVHERLAPDERGKGQALRWLLGQLKDDERIDAFVFVDADTVMDGNFLEAADRRLRSSQDVIQASYRVRDPASHPLVGLRALAFALFHDLRGRGKAALGLSCGLWGNGMVLSRAIVAQIPWQSFTAVEDAEQHLKMLLQGSKVTFMQEARVYGYMPSSFGAARQQQTRWEGGRLTLVRRYGRQLLAAGWRRRSPALAAALLDLALPPLSVLIMFSAGLLLLAALAGGETAAVIAAACLAGLALYVVRGLVAARLPLGAYASLLYAPVYICWKLWLFAGEFIRRRDPDWVRTARNG
jgi:cellulose synthase/poly-beta-1,6-N-acetylglucosamine synthase-like glycosyltransferase